jgi:hypothetical protein
MALQLKKNPIGYLVFVIPGLAQREPGTQGITKRRAFAPGFRIATSSRPE